MDRRWLKALLRSSLHTSSIYLIGANVVNNAFGFLFWSAAARLFTPQDVGLGAAAISVIGLLVVISTLGLDATIVRFLPHAPDRRRIINTAAIAAATAALLSSAAFVAGLNLWTPALVPLRRSAVFVLGLPAAAVCTTLLGVFGGALLARKQTGLVLAQSTVFGATKLLAVLGLAVVGGAAVLVGAWAVGTGVAAGTAVWFMRRGHPAETSPAGRDSISGVKKFAFANYAVTVLGTAPVYLLPLIIVNLAGPEANAYFYVASSISGLLAMIPTAAGLSLFAHGSHDTRSVTVQAATSMRLALGLLLPALVAVWLLGDRLLLLFGRTYSEEGTRLLWVLALANLPLTVNVFFFNVRKVQQRMRDVVIAMGWILTVTVALSLTLLPRFGLLGVAFTWLIAQASVAAVILLCYGRGRDWGLLHAS